MNSQKPSIKLPCRLCLSSGRPCRLSGEMSSGSFSCTALPCMDCTSCCSPSRPHGCGVSTSTYFSLSLLTLASIFSLQWRRASYCITSSAACSVHAGICTGIGPPRFKVASVWSWDIFWTALVHTTDLYKYSIQMPYLLFTPYHII